MPELESCSSSTVHVWRVDLARYAGRPDALSADERERAARLRFSTHRERFIRCRSALRTILATYAHTAPERLAMAYGPWGKPRVAEPGAARHLRFSVTHANALALIAITWGIEVGVDLEAVCTDVRWQSIVRSHFSQGEQDEVLSAGCPVAFYDCWTRKEALLKALGTGLSSPLDQFTVVPLSEPARIAPGIATTGDRGWTVCSLAVDPGFSAALAVEGDCTSIQIGARQIQGGALCAV